MAGHARRDRSEDEPYGLQLLKVEAKISFSRDFKPIVRLLAGTRDLEDPDGTGQERGASRFIIHDDFHNATHRNDIALVELDSALELNNGLLLSLAKKYGTCTY